MMKIADINQLKIGTLLPTPKGVALALLEVCWREDVTVHEIIKFVQADPALSGRLIQRANSASQTTRAIISVAEAIFRIGLSTVKQLAMEFSLIDPIKKILVKDSTIRNSGHTRCSWRSQCKKWLSDAFVRTR
jgi:HD-like signal output (HDOD) protein